MKKVLIVDDDASARFIFYKLVNDLGYIITMADSAELALDILMVNKDFDLIITDMVMKGINGDEFVKKMVESKHYPKVPVILCSGITSKDEILKCLRTGINLFMEKPINGPKLQAHILKMLEPNLADTLYK
jgi:two-component system chemotaxis sensor kinase CheA